MKFELFMGCLGNGTTVCNKAICKNGDYEMVAHISDAGNIKLYVKESYIPAEDMRKIKNTAEKQRMDFVKHFESMSELQQYGVILDNMPLNKLIELIKPNVELKEKIEKMKEYFYSIM